MENDIKNKIEKMSVHGILAHSYSVYLFFFLISVCLDFVFPIKIFNNLLFVYFGFILLVLGTFLIFWAQKTSRNLQKANITKETFCGGPYRYTRIPTSFGLFFLVFGFGLVTNTFFIALFTPASFFIAKFVFIEKQEKMLAEKYGVPYLEYKKIVRF